MDWLTQDLGIPRGLALLILAVLSFIGYRMKKQVRVEAAPPPPLPPPPHVEATAAQVAKAEADAAAAVEEAHTKPLDPVPHGEVPEFEALRDALRRKP